MTDLLTILKDRVAAPDFLTPWLDRFYEPEEIDLICTWDRGKHKSITPGTVPGSTPEQLQRSWKRGVLDTTDPEAYAPADFHTRYDLWALFEGFKDVPQDIRTALNQWELDNYSRSCEPDLAYIRLNGHGDPAQVTPRYLLVHETMEVLDRVEHIYLWPCNCRSMMQTCSKPVFTCIRFDNKRGIGFEISREKARTIILEANKKGLMQSGELGMDTRGRIRGAICNCCSDCCFPHLFASRNGAAKLWPLSRYVAALPSDPCRLCGRCARRCPFDAISFTPGKKERPADLVINTDQCRGCGVCATGCPDAAIAMIPLPGAAPFLPEPC